MAYLEPSYDFLNVQYVAASPTSPTISDPHSSSVYMKNDLSMSLLDFLHNFIVFRHTCPYLSVSDLLKLAAVSKSFRALIYNENSELSDILIYPLRKGLLSTLRHWTRKAYLGEVRGLMSLRLRETFIMDRSGASSPSSKEPMFWPVSKV